MGFQTILGHERPLTRLTQAMRQERVHHAWLFAGPAGVGKRTVAMTFARALNCAQGNGDACEECLSCKKIHQGVHPDLLIVGEDRAAAQITVEAVRERILRVLSYKIYEGRFRVVVILNAERMNPTTANALLKTLEEPPPQTVFILTSLNLTALLPTIRSRCQKLTFSPIPEAQVAGFLEQEQGIAPDQAWLLARLAEGSLGRALALSPRILEARAAFGQIFLQAVTGHGQDPFALADKLIGEKTDRHQTLITLEQVETLLRDALVLQQAPGVPLRSPDLEAVAFTLSQRLSFASLNRLLELAWELRGALKLNLRGQQLMERLFLELAQQPRASHGSTALASR